MKQITLKNKNTGKVIKLVKKPVVKTKMDSIPDGKKRIYYKKAYV